MAGFAFMMLPMAPLILDLISPLNDTRIKILPLEGEYFVDNQQYYFHLFFFISVVAFFILGIITICDTTYVMFTHHLMGLFTIIT